MLTTKSFDITALIYDNNYFQQLVLPETLGFYVYLTIQEDQGNVYTTSKVLFNQTSAIFANILVAKLGVYYPSVACDNCVTRSFSTFNVKRTQFNITNQYFWTF